MKLSQINILNELEEDEGIQLEVEIYKPIDVEKADGKFRYLLVTEVVVVVNYEIYITTTEEVGNCIKRLYRKSNVRSYLYEKIEFKTGNAMTFDEYGDREVKKDFRKNC